MLNRLESRFGNVATEDSVMQEFYTATQKQDESVTKWSLRLGDILEKAVKKEHVRKDVKDKMLSDKFFNYLRSGRLKNATRTKYEKLTSFEDLCRTVREEENDMKIRSGVQHQITRQGQQPERKEENDEKYKLMAEINSRKQQLRNQQNQQQSFGRNRRRYQGRRGPKQQKSAEVQ